MVDEQRYQRQIVLPEIGQSGQQKLKQASVLVIGAGGLGCPVLQYLAGAGIGKIGIVDFDIVEETNLHRQILFTVDDTGNNKAETAKAHLAKLNPAIEIHAYAFELEPGNAQDLFSRYDLIIDGTDNFSTKFLINDAALKTGKPFVYGSVLGFEGQVSVFNFKDGPCYRCLFPEVPKNNIPNCAEAGVIGAVAGIIGTMQAMEAIKIIVGDESFHPLSGRVLLMDMKTMAQRLIMLPKDINCRACSMDKNVIKLESHKMDTGSINEVSPEDIKRAKGAILIDVREQGEWDCGHIDGAHHFALSVMLGGQTPDFPKDEHLILYCQKGMRSMQAAQYLQASGFTNICSMQGGYDNWQKCNTDAA